MKLNKVAKNYSLQDLIQSLETICKAIELCEKHRYSFFWSGYSMKSRGYYESINSMSSIIVVPTIGELDIEISTRYSTRNTYFTSRFVLNGERRDLRIARKSKRILEELIEIKQQQNY